MFKFTKFVVNPRVGDEVGNELCPPLLRRLLTQAGNAADRHMPVDTGRARASRREVITGSGSEISAELRYEVDYMVHLEFGTEDTPTFAPLRKALSEIEGIL